MPLMSGRRKLFPARPTGRQRPWDHCPRRVGSRHFGKLSQPLRRTSGNSWARYPPSGEPDRPAPAGRRARQCWRGCPARQRRKPPLRRGGTNARKTPEDSRNKSGKMECQGKVSSRPGSGHQRAQSDRDTEDVPYADQSSLTVHNMGPDFVTNVGITGDRRPPPVLRRAGDGRRTAGSRPGSRQARPTTRPMGVTRSTRAFSWARRAACSAVRVCLSVPSSGSS